MQQGIANRIGGGQGFKASFWEKLEQKPTKKLERNLKGLWMSPPVHEEVV